jgi:hypothetical protein
VQEYDKGDETWGRPPVLRVAKGASVESAISAAAQFSKTIGSTERWNYAGDSDVAVGVFQADTGRMYLGALLWASENNGDDEWISMAKGDKVSSLVPELVAVVSDTAIARFK